MSSSPNRGELEMQVFNGDDRAKLKSLTDTFLEMLMKAVMENENFVSAKQTTKPPLFGRNFSFPTTVEPSNRENPQLLLEKLCDIIREIIGLRSKLKDSIENCKDEGTLMTMTREDDEILVVVSKFYKYLVQNNLSGHPIAAELEETGVLTQKFLNDIVGASIQIAPLMTALRANNVSDAIATLDKILGICKRAVGDNFVAKDSFSNVKSGTLQFIIAQLQRRSSILSEMEFKLMKFAVYLVLVEDDDKTLVENFQDIINIFNKLLSKVSDAYHQSYQGDDSCAREIIDSEASPVDSPVAVICNCSSCNDSQELCTLVAAATKNLSILLTKTAICIPSDYVFVQQQRIFGAGSVSAPRYSQQQGRLDLPRAAAEILEVVKTVTPLCMIFSESLSTPNSMMKGGYSVFNSKEIGNGIKGGSELSIFTTGRTVSNSTALSDPVIEYPKVDVACVFCSAAISALAEVKICRQNLVQGQVLKLLTNWTNQAAFMLRSTYDETPKDTLMVSLIQSTLKAISLLCEGDSKNRDNYHLGVVDAQATTEGLAKSLVDLVDAWLGDPDVRLTSLAGTPIDSKNILSFFNKKIESAAFTPSETVLLTDIDSPRGIPQAVFIDISKIFSSFASRVNNRPQLVSARVPTALAMILMNVASRKRYLFNLLERDNPLKKSTNFVDRDLEIQELHFCSIGNFVLGAVANFLRDITSDYSRMQFDVQPAALHSIIHSEFFTHILKDILSMEGCNARMYAVEVLEIISEWNGGSFIEQMIACDIDCTLVSICQEAVKYLDTKDPQRAMSPFCLSPFRPSFDRSLSIGSVRSVRSGRSAISRSVSQSSYHSVDSVDVSQIDNEYSIFEEVLFVCRTLANICASDPALSSRLFKAGLYDILLCLVKSNMVHVRRDAMRCLSSICCVVGMIDGGTASKVPSEFYLGDSQKYSKFVYALSVFDKALTSDLDFSQLESLRGLANLAVDDLLSVDIVQGPLREIISLARDPDKDDETRKAASSVLVQLGFSQGLEYDNLITTDYLLLVEWFYMKKSLKAQKYAYLLLCEFFRRFFDPNADDKYKESITKFVRFLDRFQALREFRKKQISRSSKISHTQMLSRSQQTPPYATYHFSDVFKYFSFCHPLSLQDTLIDDDDSQDGEDYLKTPSQLSSIEHHSCMDKDTFYEKVYEYLDTFFPCRLMQDAFIGLACIGQSSILPYRVRTIQLPSRPYHSFSREARLLNNLLQEIIDENKLDNEEDENEGIDFPTEGHKNVYVCLSFEDSTFDGDFHIGLLQLLRQCPHINSLSFTCKEPSQDTTLGRIVGDIPPSISHVVFDGALSSDALQTLCVMLHSKNEAWVHSHIDSNDGLIGLAIKQHKFSKEDLRCLLEMLDPTGFDTELVGTPTDERNRSSDAWKDRAESPVPVTGQAFLKEDLNIEKCGLKYLDLSYCKLSDISCARILRAATTINSSIEGLDFEGNIIGKHFMEAFSEVMKEVGCRLRYIGLKNTCLTKPVFFSFLDTVKSCSSLNGFDVSNNNLGSIISHGSPDSIEEFRRALKDCFQLHKSLRYVDLSYNEFPREDIISIYIALVSNKSIQILLLVGNPGVRGCQEYEEIEKKLIENRKLIGKNSTSNRETTIFAGSGGGIKKSKVDESEVHVHLPEAVASYSISAASATATATAATILEAHLEIQNPAQDQGETSISETEIDVPSSNNVLCVLFSVPLAWKDRNQKLHGIEMLDYEFERKHIWHSFQAAKRDIEVQFDFATTHRLRTAVTLGCRALHFSGHGHPQGLNFENGKGGLQFVKVETLKDLCVAGGSKLEFVFVSACHSKLAGEAFAAAGVPHVVCVKLDARLLDQAANEFTRAFYLALAVGKTVKDAFDIGKQMVAACPYFQNNSTEVDKFILLPEDPDNLIHNKSIFNAGAVRCWPIDRPRTNLGLYSGRNLISSVPDTSHIPLPPEDFEGRERDMHIVISRVHEKRLIVLVGEAGMGKSSVVCACCQYMEERCFFEDGVKFFRLKEFVSNHDDFLKLLDRNIVKGIKEPPVHSTLSVRPKEDSSAIAGSRRRSSSTESIIGLPDLQRYEDEINAMEEAIIAKLITSKSTLIVLDHFNCVQSSTSTNTKLFLARMLDRCRNVKVLITSTDSLYMKHVTVEPGVIEHAHTLGPLTLYSTLKLFTRLCTFMSSQSKVDFVNALLPDGRGDFTILERECSGAAGQILQMFGNGKPSKIAEIALNICTKPTKSSEDDVQSLLDFGQRLISEASGISTHAEIDLISHDTHNSSLSTLEPSGRESV